MALNGTCGVFAAAAAAAACCVSIATRPRHAIGIAASSSSGIWAFIHDGTMTKRLHAGRAAEGGLLAGVLAQGGITGPTRIFDEVWGGFLKSYAHAPVDPDAPDARARRVLAHGHRGDQALRVMPRHALRGRCDRAARRERIAPDDVVRVEVRANDFLIGMVGGSDVATMPAAQMSLPYAVSARLVFGSAGLSAIRN